MTRRPRLLLTPGDPEGVGPELVRKIFAGGGLPKGAEILCVGAKAPLAGKGVRPVEIDPHDLGAEGFRLPSGKGVIPVIAAPAPPSGSNAFAPGFQSGWAIETAVRLIQAGRAQGLVTGPISKERLQKGGFNFRGHTDFLASLAGGKRVTMMLANERLRVSLVTTHVPLSQVSAVLTEEGIRGAFERTHSFLTERLGIRRPRILVCGLNPHAGENGLLGDEELRLIAPAVARLAQEYEGRAEISGPIASDTLFAVNDGKRGAARADAVLAMYHDQGLIPVKLLDFARTVNITLGLPFPRTSVDHGVAFDLVGKNLADPSSLKAALAWGARLSAPVQHTPTRKPVRRKGK